MPELELELRQAQTLALLGTAPADTLVALGRNIDDGNRGLTVLCNAGFIRAAHGGRYQLTPEGARWVTLEMEKRGPKPQRIKVTLPSQAPIIAASLALLAALAGFAWVTL